MSILSIIILVLVCILIFIPAKPSKNNHPIGTEGIQITAPQANEEISSPLKITGTVTGNGWGGFEGQVGTVKLLNGTGKELAAGILTATTEWTTLPTNFETTLNFATPETENGSLVFKNENASGSPAKDKIFSLPVKIK